MSAPSEQALATVVVLLALVAVAVAVCWALAPYLAAALTLRY